MTSVVCVVENGLDLFPQDFSWVFKPLEWVFQGRNYGFLYPTSEALDLLLLLHVKLLNFTDCKVKLFKFAYLLCLFIKLNLLHSLEYDLIPRYDLFKELYELFDCLSSGLNLLIKVLLNNHVDSPPLNNACMTVFEEPGKLFQVYSLSLIESYAENIDSLLNFVTLHVY